MTRCRFEDCGEPVHKLGYCADHYHTNVTENGGVDANATPRERPILFSAPLVRALLAGTKTQTRRIVKAPPRHWSEHLYIRDGREVWEPTGYTQIRPSTGGDHAGKFIWQIYPLGSTMPPKPSPYGVPGDRLWVRETFDAPPGSERRQEVAYRADFERDPEGATWRPSIFMPRWASRITLEVTEIRAERLQSISEEDATAEGVTPAPLGASWTLGPRGMAHVETFKALWNQINGERASWASNPWVWVVSFRRLP